MKHSFLFTATSFLLASVATAQVHSVAGIWQAGIQVTPTTALTAYFDLQGTAPILTGAMSVPQQSTKSFVLNSVVVRHDSLLLAADALKGRFAGKFSADGQQVAGAWVQNGTTFPVTLRRSSAKDKAAAAPRRPQTPQAPFPYQSQDLTFPNKKAGFDLAGTLTLPAGPGPFPAVVLVTGSGPEDRNETVFGHQPFLVLADYLTRRGFAVLRYDDRGVGQSKGTFKGALTTDFTTDALAALAYLRTRPDIRPHQVALMGHSEGGSVVWQAAAQPGGPDLAVALAGPGLPGDAILLRQQADLARAAGADSTSIGAKYRLYRALFTELHRVPTSLPSEELIARLIPVVQQQMPGLSAEQARPIVAQLASPWMRDFLLTAPAPYLAKVKCPVLAINGVNDLQVAADDNLPAIVRGLRAAHNRDVTTRTLPQLNHLFQTDPTAKANYGAIEETFAPAALLIIGDWLSTHTDAKAMASQ